MAQNTRVLREFSGSGPILEQGVICCQCDYRILLQQDEYDLDGKVIEDSIKLKIFVVINEAERYTEKIKRILNQRLPVTLRPDCGNELEIKLEQCGLMDNKFEGVLTGDLYRDKNLAFLLEVPI